MTHEDATAYAKARAYDGSTAYVMRQTNEREVFGSERSVRTYTYTDVVSETSRAAHEAQGWEVVETYEPKQESGHGLVDGGKMYKRAMEAKFLWRPCRAGVHDWEYGDFRQSDGQPRSKTCRRCGVREYCEGGVLGTMVESGRK